MGQDLLQEGIAAFQAGDREKARELFMLVVEVDARNERAWYYLAVLESDSARRREYLEHVIEINPKNEKAREVLDRLKARQAVPVESAAAESSSAAASASPSPAPKSSRIRALNPAAESPGAASTSGFALPFNIPGAPLRISPESLLRDGSNLLRTAFQTYGRTSGATLLTSELSKATWWRFWLLTAFVAVIVALTSIVTSLVIVLRFNLGVAGFLSILLTPLLALPAVLIMEYAGVYASYRYAVTRGGGSGSLVRHAYGIALRWLPLVVVYAEVTFVLMALGAVAPLLFFLIMVMMAVIMLSEVMDKVHVMTDPQQKWFTSGIMVAGAIVAGVILAIILGGFIFTGAIPFMIG
ncbi:MAG: hypothetical protein IAE80_22675 [Anaerolinea sp.]|nr:hypothetical protein [Anaerolinea sp.]